MTSLATSGCLGDKVGELSTPGTVHLVDVQQTSKALHASATSDIVLVPTPSSDPDDPLNWSSRRKALFSACVCIYTVVIGIAASSLYSVLTPITQNTELTLDQLNNGTGYMFLLFGWGCLFWQPIALQYGKRPVYLISMLGTLAIVLWQPHTKTNGQYIASKLLQGFFGAPTESLCEISMADVWFQHERGTYVGLFSFMLAGSNFFASFISGFINDGMGWQWVFYWCAIFVGVGLVFCLFFWEESNYDRVHELDTRPVSPRQSRGTEASQTDTKTLDFDVLDPSSEKAVDPVNSHNRTVSKQQKKPYWKRLSVIPEKKPFYLWKMIPRPLIFLQFPVFAWAGFSYGAHLIWFNVLNGTASSFLSAPPYNFRPSIIGVAYLAPTLGAAFSSLLTGRIGDWFVLKLARRNNGVLESEQRLWLFIASVILIPSGLILWGVGAAHNIHWFGLVFAMGMLGAANVVGVQLSVMYAIDSYKDLSGEGLVSVILVRNTMSFAIGYGITPWVEGMGKQNAFITAAFVGLAQALTFLPMVKYGKELRDRSKRKYYRYVDESKSMGLVH